MDFFSTAQIVGYVALAFGVTSFLQRKDRNLKFFNACECAAYTLHFCLLGNFTAMGSASISATRSAIAIWYRRKWMFFIFFSLNLIVGLTIAKSPAGWLPVVASCCATFGLFYMSGLRMRLMFLSSTTLWIANNIISGSIGGTVLECMIFTANGTTIIKMLLAEFSRSRITMTGGMAALRAAFPDSRVQRHFPFARRMYARRRARSFARARITRRVLAEK